MESLLAVGRAEDYFIHPGYETRIANDYYDDSAFEDEWQREVYQLGRELAEAEGLRRVLDIGAGSGFKLVNYFGTLDTLGLDLPPTVEKLKKKYPARNWAVCDFAKPPAFSPDLVMCSDVIEHLPAPGELLRFILQLKPRFVVLSTPDRNLLLGAHAGPPRNRAHVREWNMPELRAPSRRSST